MRLKADIWVKAYMRRCEIEGAQALLERRGDADAGAIYIKISRLDGTAALYGPAPAGLDIEREDRLWAPVMPTPSASEADCDRFLARQIEFDPDIWIVVVEDRQGRHFLDDWLMKPR
ncbi:MAG: DUF1491 family protein [Hyphomicrobiaceae bacterium]|nr:DUF1491 family protein [Hyphomicrobiaceae bacterium]